MTAFFRSAPYIKCPACILHRIFSYVLTLHFYPFHMFIGRWPDVSLLSPLKDEGYGQFPVCLENGRTHLPMAALVSPSGAYRHLSLLKKIGIRQSIPALFVAEARYKYINTSLSSLVSPMLRRIRASTNSSEQTWHVLVSIFVSQIARKLMWCSWMSLERKTRIAAKHLMTAFSGLRKVSCPFYHCLTPWSISFYSSRICSWLKITLHCPTAFFFRNLASKKSMARCLWSSCRTYPDLYNRDNAVG
jgi:hypothetical protein